MSRDATNLGELEMAVMEHVWEQGSTDVKVAHRAIGARRAITPNTVQSTLKRLWEKGLLERHKEGHAYVYGARVDRRQLTERLVGELVDQVAGARIDVALEAFVNLADQAGDDTLAALEHLVARRRADQEKK